MVIEEQDENHNETARNVYGRNLITRETNANKVVYGFNGHGDVVYYTNLGNIVLVVYEYDEFGNIISAENVFYHISTLLPAPVPGDNIDGSQSAYYPITEIDNPYRYAGYEYIKEIGIYDLNARYYNPEIARFLSPDPYYNLGNRVIGLYEINVPNAWSIIQANNIYVYCGNSPIIFFDPTGRITEEEIELYETGQLSQDVYDILVNLGERWENASTQAARDEIHGLAERFRNNGYKYSDLTDKANEELENNKLSICGYTYFMSNSSDFSVLFWYATAGLDWYTRVDNDGEWDYKKVPASWMPKNEDYFVYNGELISFADFGNINYGYTGTILGIEPKTLYKAAGYVQIGKLNNSAKQYYGDSEVDYFNVKKGIKFANDEGFEGALELPLSLIFEVMK